MKDGSVQSKCELTAESMTGNSEDSDAAAPSAANDQSASLHV